LLGRRNAQDLRQVIGVAGTRRMLVGDEHCNSTPERRLD
jgi:hypothetical protein